MLDLDNPSENGAPPPSALIWTEKYRPQTLSEMALSEENRTLLEGYIRQGDFPHLLLSGPPGVGKTTVAKILTSVVPCEVLTLNASNERGIDTIREKVGLFARGMYGPHRNVVFLDEADGLTGEAQDTLRNMMETFSDQTRFILTCNRAHRVIAAIQSRCTMIELGEVPLGERAKVLLRVLRGEGHTITNLGVVFDHAAAYPDLRRMLSTAQKSLMTKGGLESPGPADGMALLQLIQQRNWKELISRSKLGGFDHAEQLKGLFWAINPDERGSTARLVVVAKAVQDSTWTRDPVVLFLGCCAELMELAP